MTILMLLFVIILVLFILYYIIFKFIYTKKYKRSNKKKEVIIVVARYNEDLKWINTYPFNKFKYIIYNKGINDNFEKNNVINIINLNNVGRECHTFLYHIYTNYDNLHDITIFLPGSVEMIHKKIIAECLLKNVYKYKKAFFICQPITKLFKKCLYTFSIDKYSSNSKQNNNLNKLNIIEKAKIRPFGKWYKHHINNNFNINYLSYNCIFSVDKRDILNNTKKFYYDLMNEINFHHNHETGHYLERSWAALFNIKYTIIKNNNFFQHLFMEVEKYLQYSKSFFNINND